MNRSSSQVLFTATAVLGVASFVVMTQRLDGAAPVRPALPMRAAPPAQQPVMPNNVRQQPQISSGYMGNRGNYQWNQMPGNFGGNNAMNGFNGQNIGGFNSMNGFNGQPGFNGNGWNGNNFNGNGNRGGFNGQWGGPNNGFNGQWGGPNNGNKGGAFCGFIGV